MAFDRLVNYDLSLAKHLTRDRNVTKPVFIFPFFAFTYTILQMNKINEGKCKTTCAQKGVSIYIIYVNKRAMMTLYL